jgi:hypothetical protein
MLAGGKDDALAIVAHARISSICVAVLSSTICTFYLVLSRLLMSFRMQLEYLTGVLAEVPLFEAKDTSQMNMELKFHIQHLSEEPASEAEADSHAHYIVRLGMILLLLARGRYQLC